MSIGKRMAQLRKAREAAARKRALAAEAEHTDAPTDLGLGVNTGPRTRKTLAGLIARGKADRRRREAARLAAARLTAMQDKRRARERAKLLAPVAKAIKKAQLK